MIAAIVAGYIIANAICTIWWFYYKEQYNETRLMRAIQFFSLMTMGIFLLFINWSADRMEDFMKEHGW